MTQHIIGIDISKDTLDVCCLPGGDQHRFDNTNVGHKALVRLIAAHHAAHVIFEPTGPYHRALEQALSIAGIAIVKVNPRQARRFAEATGKFAKTDRLDAAMLARMGMVLALEPRPVRNKILSDLKQLHIARDALVKDRTAAKNRAKNITLPLLKRQNTARLKHIETQINDIETAITAIVNADTELAARLAILISIPGIAKLSAFALLIEMPELGSLDGKQVASLAGLAPITRQSGSWKGHAFIRGGRANLRQALYMPALVAARFNPDFKQTYKHLTSAGKPAKVAITAIMRKLIVLANTLIAQNRNWVQKTT
jgi:transposase